MNAIVVPDTGDEALDVKIKEWLEWDRNKVTISEAKELIEENDAKKLSKLFLNRLEFGTAGLRARMGAGFNRMNDLVVIQSAQGLVRYLLETFHDACERGFVIGYDGRYNSRRFAELTAAVFLNGGFKVYLYSNVCPTPFVPFAITLYGCVAGVMVTASHNPKEDNGYKVYWENGAQIISPHDKNIQKVILKNLEPWENSWDVSVVSKGDNLPVDPLEDAMANYYKKLSEIVLFPDINKTCDLKIAYSAMHGVGYKYMVEAFKTGNLNDFVVVEEQKDPDPEFPTVRFPNPEEGKSALNLSIKTALENDCTLILANDPDADRLAVAEKSVDGVRDWKIFTGNELGALLGWWSLFCYKHKHSNVQDLSDVYMLSSTVSSKILGTMARTEKFNFEETLTGFKWMGNVSDDLIKSGKQVLFAFEEAIGFMCGNAVLDKDGISAAVKVAEMAAYLHLKNGMSLQEKLREIYSFYGHHITLNSYFVCHEPKVMQEIFRRLRNYDEESDKSYPKFILNGKYAVTGVRDLTTGHDSSYEDGKARLPVSKSSQMITFHFANGLVATLRTSGTEPKLKYYTELCADKTEQNLKELEETLKEMVDALTEEFLEPSKNRLIPRSD